MKRVMVRFLITFPLNKSIADTGGPSEFESTGFLSCPVGNSVPLPEAILDKTALDSSSRPCTSSHLGDSGTTL